MKYLCGEAIKKPVKVNFFKYKGYSTTHMKELQAWIESYGDNFKDTIKVITNSVFVNTLEGSSYELPENYVVIRGVRGEYYPCSPEVFEETYDIM